MPSHPPPRPRRPSHCGVGERFIAALCRRTVYFTVRYPVMEIRSRLFIDEHGNEVRLTCERLRHILRRHPKMAFQMHRFAETLASPDAVGSSRFNQAVLLYYRLYSGPAGQEPLYLPRGEAEEDPRLHPHRLSRPESQRTGSMATRKVFVSYDHEVDMLEVLWAFRDGYFTPTDDERILKRLDYDGEVIGFLIQEMSTLNQPEPIEFELASEAPADDVANVTVKQAALRLGVSERRVRKLARDGRMRGSDKGGSGVADPHTGRGDSGKARSFRRRRACYCKRGVKRTHPSKSWSKQWQNAYLDHETIGTPRMNCTSQIHLPSTNSAVCVQLLNPVRCRSGAVR